MKPRVRFINNFDLFILDTTLDKLIFKFKEIFAINFELKISECFIFTVTLA